MSYCHDCGAEVAQEQVSCKECGVELNDSGLTEGDSFTDHYRAEPLPFVDGRSKFISLRSCEARCWWRAV
jgi:uncharacterized membrane protein YvbJ